MAAGDTDARLTSHEQICSERYLRLEGRMATVETRLDGVDARLKKIESVIIRSVGALLVGMGGLIATIIMKVG
jgi:hypothetical protein